MVIDVESGWIRDARKVSSPHCDARPAGCVPELIVVHGISLPPREFGGPWIDDLFTGNLDRCAHPYFESIASTRVSAHVLIARTGCLTQYVSFSARAWHAGRSSHRGRECCNDYSIGIELEGTDDVPYESVQYEQLASLIAALKAAYPSLATAQIVGHSDIAPGRKSDPGPAFQWPVLQQLLHAKVSV